MRKEIEGERGRNRDIKVKDGDRAEKEREADVKRGT